MTLCPPSQPASNITDYPARSGHWTPVEFAGTPHTGDSHPERAQRVASSAPRMALRDERTSLLPIAILGATPLASYLVVRHAGISTFRRLFMFYGFSLTKRLRQQDRQRPPLNLTFDVRTFRRSEVGRPYRALYQNPPFSSPS